MVGDRSGRGEPERWTEKCSEVSHCRDHMRRLRKTCQSSLFAGRDAALLVVSRPNEQNGGELRQPVTRMAKRYEPRAARSSRCGASFRW
jgi:hypothetical protein